MTREAGAVEVSASPGALATAVIAAAGSGTRLGAGGPKALVELGGRPLVAWSLAALEAAESIGAIVIAAPQGLEDELRALAGGARVVTGGATRSQSVASALEAVDSELVVVHDAARPLATPRLFDEVVSALVAEPGCDALVAAAPLADTVKRASSELTVTETISREGLWAVQTPQAFRTASLRRALGAPADRLAAATDDAMLIEAAGGLVRLHPVAEPNPKVTTAEDLQVAMALMAGR